MNSWPYPCSLHTNIIKNAGEGKTILNGKPNNVYNSMFSTIDKTFHNHHFISTRFNYIIPS